MAGRGEQGFASGQHLYANKIPWQGRAEPATLVPRAGGHACGQGCRCPAPSRGTRINFFLWVVVIVIGDKCVHRARRPDTWVLFLALLLVKMCEQERTRIDSQLPGLRPVHERRSTGQPHARTQEYLGCSAPSPCRAAAHGSCLSKELLPGRGQRGEQRVLCPLLQLARPICKHAAHPEYSRHQQSTALAAQQNSSLWARSSLPGSWLRSN